MKRFFALLILWFSTIAPTLAQQTSFQWVNPLPQGNILNSVQAIDKDTVYGVGDYGTIIKTTNGGKTWQFTPTAAGTTEPLYVVQFVTPSMGWCFGEFGRILKTTDAGRSWFNQVNPTFKDIFAADFISSTTGWAVGGQGTILKTADGGNTWNIQTSGLTTTFYGVNFLDALTGWVVGVDGKLLKTTNGGTTWEQKATGTIQNLYSVQFLNASVGYTVGSFGTILRSTDGGSAWIPQTSSTDLSLYSLQFTSALTGWATGSYGVIVKTTNGGFTWFQQNSNTYNDIFSLHFASSTTGWGVGDYGTIVATTDGGTSWTSQSSGIRSILNAISFPTASLGIAVGEEGSIARSTDGGSSWTQPTSGVLQTLWGVHMLNSTLGWAVGDSAVILRTTNGGLTWVEQHSHTDISLYSVSFVSPTVGRTVGDYGTILVTTNGGVSWRPETTNVSFSLLKVKFLTESTGWAVGYGGTILKTTDAGAHWVKQTSPTGQTLNSLDIVNANTVFVCGDFGTILSTTNGGTTWGLTTIEGWASFYGIAFRSTTTGWAAGDDGTIVRTTDGGLSWDFLNSGTYNSLWDLIFLRGVTGGGTLFAAGVGGTLLCSGITPLPVRTWTGAYDSLWTSAGNWSPMGVPDKGDSVIISPSPYTPVLRVLLQQVNLAGLRIAPGARLYISNGLAQFVISGTLKIEGTLELDPASTLEIIAGDNLAFGTAGNLIPGQSTVMINYNGQLRGKFFNLYLASGATVQSIGNSEIKNNLTIHTNMTLRQIDTLTILNPYTQGFQGDGIISGGTIKRAIRQGSTVDYRFESPATYVRFHPVGTMPDTVLMTSYPNTLGPFLSQENFVRRFYTISAIGGSGYRSLLSLRYDSLESSISIDNLGLFRDSSGIILNMGVTDFLDSDLVAISLDSVSRFSTWYIGQSDYTWKHPYQYTDSLLITDNGFASATLYFGTAPGATDGIDSYWGETQLSPKPPLGTFDARWDIPSTNGTRRDIRGVLSNTHQQIIYRGTFQPGPGGYPFTLRWDKAVIPFGSIILRDGVTQGGFFSIDMRQSNSVIISSPFITSVEIVSTAPTYYTFKQGWNMVSLPVKPWSDNRKGAIFPTSTSSAFGYSTMYYAADTLAHGSGYWLKFSGLELVPLDGAPLLTDTISLHEGWNMIGSLPAPFTTAEIVQDPPNNVKSSYYFYDVGYTNVDTLYPARGYWVKVNQVGKLIYPTKGPVAGKAATLSRRDELTRSSTITLTDREGYHQVLYLLDGENANLSLEDFELPPPPPEGMFDARFTSNRMVESFAAASGKRTITFQTLAFPVTIAWEIKSEKITSFRFTNPKTGRAFPQEISSRIGSIEISEPSVTSFSIEAEGGGTVPRAFALRQNYPNPFNPSTVIEFELPVDAAVTLKIYDILGQEVATLLENEPSEAGLHHLQFSPLSRRFGSGSSSGIYFYRLTAQSGRSNFTDVKKMLFLK